MRKKNKNNKNAWRLPRPGLDTNLNTDRYGYFGNFDTYRRFPRNNTSTYNYQTFSPQYVPQNYHINDKSKQISKAKKSLVNPPALGSEEHTMLKIKQTSAIIMRHILSPEENIISKSMENNNPDIVKESASQTDTSVKTGPKINKTKAKETIYSVDEIHNKIMCHLTNLKDGRMKNFINSKSTGYDAPIQDILKQKRLEISRALRNVCSDGNDTQCTDFINSIIPDMGIKIEDLPQEFLEQLRSSFDFGLEDDFSSGESDCSVQIIEKDVPKITIDDDDDNEISNENILSGPDESIAPVFDPLANKDSFKDFNSATDFANTVEVPEENDSIINKTFPTYQCIVPIENDSNMGQTIAITNPQNTELDQNIPESHQPSCLTEMQISEEEERSDTLEKNVVCTASNSSTHEEIMECSQYSDAFAQTENSTGASVDFLLKQAFPNPPKDMATALNQMSLLDKCITDLLEYRKNVIYPFLMGDSSENREKVTVTNEQGKIIDELVVKKRKIEDESNLPVAEKDVVVDVDMAVLDIEDDVSETSSSDMTPAESIDLAEPKETLLKFQETKENILDLQVFDDTLMAATGSGRILFYSLKGGSKTNTLKVTSGPILSLLCLGAIKGKTLVCVTTSDGLLKIYNFHTHRLMNKLKLEENAQCMEHNWGYIFLGGSKGLILRFNIKKRAIEYEDKFSNDCIFVLKATHEGARRVLLIGSRNSPVVIRDAMNGLHLRTMQDVVCPTVYSLVIKNNRLYCGTTNQDILVFNFHSGLLEHKLMATNAKGIGCLKSWGRLLFASCHNGNVFVYNIENNSFIGIMQGPGGVILSMEVVLNQVVVGTMSNKFVSLPIPKHILKQK